MSIKSNRKEFHFTPAVFLRLIIFAIIIYLSINYLSASKDPVIKNDPTVLGVEVTQNALSTLYMQLPDSSRHTLENLSSTSQAQYIKDKLEYLQSQTNGFPQKQINEIQKSIIKNVLNNYLNSLETTK